MPNLAAHAQAHRAKAERNEMLCRELLDRAPDWSVTMAFYAALHVIGQYAHLVTDEEVDLVGHAQTTAWLHKRQELRRIAPTYAKLMNYAHRARYECLPAHDALLQPETVRTRVLPMLQEVKRCVDLALRRLPPTP